MFLKNGEFSAKILIDSEEIKSEMVTHLFSHCEITLITWINAKSFFVG
jgi:ERCC4-type nuclease